MFRARTIDGEFGKFFLETEGDLSAGACLCIPGAMQGAWGCVGDVKEPCERRTPHSVVAQWSERFCRRIVTEGLGGIRFDHRDIGRSFSSPPGTEYSWVDLGEDVVAIMVGLGLESAHLVGHSMGGHLAHPSRQPLEECLSRSIITHMVRNVHG